MKLGETVKSCIECWNFSVGDRDNDTQTLIWQYQENPSSFITKNSPVTQPCTFHYTLSYFYPNIP